MGIGEVVSDRTTGLNHDTIEAWTLLHESNTVDGQVIFRDELPQIRMILLSPEQPNDTSAPHPITGLTDACTSMP